MEKPKLVELKVTPVRDILAPDGVSRFSTIYVTMIPLPCQSHLVALRMQQITLDTQNRVPIREIFLLRTVLTDSLGYTLTNEPPYSVWQTLVENERRPRLSMEQVREMVGDTLWTKLRPFQQTAVHFFAERKSMFLGDAMGAGKTLEALASMSVVRDQWPVLIVCPTSLLFNWESEITEWLGTDLRVLVLSKPKDILAKRHERQQLVQNHDFVVMSYGTLGNGMVKDWVTARKYNCAIVDESHYIKNFETQRCANVLSTLRTIKHRILASGTPFSYPRDMYSQIKAVQPSAYLHYFDNRTGQDRPERKHYVNRYCRPEKQFFGRCIQWTMNGYDRPDELHAVLETFMIRRRKEEILSQLPAKLRTTVTLGPLSEGQTKEIKELLTEAKEPSDQAANASDAKKNPYVYTEAFRLTCQYKTPKVIEFLQERLVEDFLVEDEKACALLFFHHQAMKQALENMLTENKIDYFVIDGSTSSEQRSQHQKNFQGGMYRVGILSILAAGAGLTLTRASLEIFCEILFGPEMLQAEDRAHRIGQTQDVLIEYLIEPNTTDIINFNLIRKKDRESSHILDGQAHRMQVMSSTLSSSGKRKDVEEESQTSSVARIRVVPPGMPLPVFQSRKT